MQHKRTPRPPGALCLCGCGRLAPLSKSTRHGRAIGDPVDYINGHYNKRPIESYYDVQADGCWLWTGPLSVDGYARIVTSDFVGSAHRAFYEKHVGPIDAGNEIHHRCLVRRCVNPEHLEQLTPAEHDAAHAPVGYPRSPVVGVSWNASNERWVAGLKFAGRKEHYGLYRTEEEAIEAVTRRVNLTRLGRICRECGDEVSTDRRPDAVYCSKRCERRHSSRLQKQRERERRAA